MNTKIKICGITRQQDALALADAGVDALGFVFYQKSKRNVSADQLPWMKTIPSFVQTVGLFVNPDADFVRAVCDELPLDLLQFHGDEAPEFCQQFNKRYIKAVPMQKLNANTALDYMLSYPDAAGFLLDNYGTDEIGGSGTRFDWSKIPSAADINKHQLKLIMAGGLHSENVREVIDAVNPWAVDVSSGVEEAAGIKSIDKSRIFINAVKRLT